jgi:hypothetical protein
MLYSLERLCVDGAIELTVPKPFDPDGERSCLFPVVEPISKRGKYQLCNTTL